MIKAVLKGEIKTQEASVAKLWKEQESITELSPEGSNPPKSLDLGGGADQVPSSEILQKHSGNPW